MPEIANTMGVAGLAARLSSASRAGAMVMGVRLGAAGLAFIAQVLAARMIGAEGFGAYALVLVWLILLGHTATMGTNQLICRLLSAYRTQGELGAARGLLRFSLAFAGGAALVLAALAGGIVQSGVLGLDREMVVLASMGLSVVPLLMVQDFLEAIARGLDRPLLGIGPALMVRHLAIIVGVGAVFMTGGGADAVTVMGFTIAGLGVSLLIQYGLLRRVIGASLGGAQPVYRTRQWIKTALPIATLDASETLFNNADILILGLFVSPQTVAFYFAATRLAQILGYVPYAIAAVTAQKYAALAARGEMVQLQRLVSSATLAATGATALGALVLWLLAPMLMGLFGPAFGTAAAIVPLLALGLVVACALGPGEDVLTMLGQERVCALGFALALGVNIGLNFVLIPIWGMTGAALATAMALGVRGVVLAGFARARLGLVLPVGMGRLRRYNKGAFA